jgi:Rhodanese-like domain.
MKVRRISCEELANQLRPSNVCLPPAFCIIDTRSILQYNDNHIQGAISICCSKIIRRKLQYNRISVRDLLKNNNNNNEKEFWKLLKQVVVYDEASCWDRENSFHVNHVLYILVQKLSDFVPNVALLEGKLIFSIELSLVAIQ